MYLLAAQQRKSNMAWSPHPHTRLIAAAALVVPLLVASACAGSEVRRTQEQPYSQRDRLAPPQPYGGQYLGGTATGDTEQGAAFAQWVLAQDPQQRFITDAVVRGNQSLGVKVQPTATRSDLHQLLVALAEGMARTFPGQSVEVIAFYQSGDKLAEADYDPRTGRTDVRFVQ
jgi:hypothetical protein